MTTSPNNVESRVRLRIAEIGLKPALSKRAIKTELLIDGKVAKMLPTIEGGKPLKWTKLIICDTYPSSRFGLAISARQLRMHSRSESECCLVSELIMSSTRELAIKIDKKQYTVEIQMLDPAQVEGLYAKGREKLEEMERLSHTPDYQKSTQRMFKSMLEFGSVVAEINPISRVVFAVCTCAWERVEEEQNSGEELGDLAGRLVGMAPLVSEVKKHAQLGPLRQSIEDFLHLIEDVSIFVLERKTKGFVVRVLKSVVDSSDQDRVEELAKRFHKAKGDFDTAVGAQTMTMLATADERELLKQLNPVEPSGHDPSRACQEGTRLRLLGDIDSWIHDQDSSSRFMWIHGQAGIGKSTVSTSVCERLYKQQIPVVSFFCKRDDPALRDPLRLINSVVHGLAFRCIPYGKLVAQIIKADSELCTSHLGPRYDGLLKQPLSKLEGLTIPPCCVVIVDALDECGTDETRQQLLGYLRELPYLVTWLRVIVTSRLDNGIRNAFDSATATPVSRVDMSQYPASNDIRAFIEASVNKVAREDKWPEDGIERLCQLAGELFIWAATACKFIIKGNDTERRLQQVLNGTSSGAGFNGLDSLYAAVITNSMVDRTADDEMDVRRCIGAIVVVSMRQPVPLEVLCQLMQQYMKPTVLRKVVARLGAVLYSDQHFEGAIRVLHPSFADFALDESRSGEFWVDPMQRNVELSMGCMHTMERELRFNICQLETSHLRNSEVHDLEAKIEANVSGQLAYSCIYWISHLLDVTDQAVERVENIINGPRLLHWLEVLSLLQRVDVALHSLRRLSQWLKSRQASDAASAWDAYRFVFAFFDPIAASAPHIYISALAFAPKQSEIYQRLVPLFPNTATVVEGGDEGWPEWLRSMSHSSSVASLCVSQDGRLLVTGCEDGSVRMFDPQTGGLISVLRHGSESSDREGIRVSISGDSLLIASGSSSGEIHLWDAKTGSVIDSIQFQDPGDDDLYLQALVFSPDGATIRALTRYNSVPPTQVTTWDITSKRITHEILFGEHTNIGAVAFSADGNHAAMVYDDRLILQPNKGITVDLDVISLPSVVVFSPDGSLIVSNSVADRCQAQIWDVNTGTAVHQRKRSVLKWPN